VTQIFGPVPSRRLGFSLGVDAVPFKTCSLDCIYCQLGKTTHKTIERKKYIPINTIVREIEKTLITNKDKKINYITFSGSGEPTLNSGIGKMIEKIKKITSIPIAVLTNGTLLHHQELQEQLQQADLIIPSLDALDEITFQAINKPHPSLTLERLISGIADFSQNFPGEIWLEIMLIKGMNDSWQQITKFSQLVKQITLEKIQLNTPVRPPAEETIRAVSASFLKRAKSILGEKCQIIFESKKHQQKAYKNDLKETILEMTKRRPVNLRDISEALGIHRNEAIKYIQHLKEEKLINSKIHNHQRYYSAKL